MVKAMKASPKGKSGSTMSTSVIANATVPLTAAAAKASKSKKRPAKLYKDISEESESEANITLFADEDSEDDNSKFVVNDNDDSNDGSSDEEMKHSAAGGKAKQIFELDESESDAAMGEDESEDEQSFIIKPKKR